MRTAPLPHKVPSACSKIVQAVATSRDSRSSIFGALVNMYAFAAIAVGRSVGRLRELFKFAFVFLEALLTTQLQSLARIIAQAPYLV